MCSNLRWCSDGLEFTCWNGDVVRMAFIIDAFDREIIAWAAVCGAGISGSDVRDMMLEAVEKRFGAVRAPHPIEHLSDNGSPYTAKQTRDFAVGPEPGALLHTGEEPGVERHVGSLRQNLQARLCSHQSFAGRHRRRFGKSPDGSTTTTRSIHIQRSGCAPRGSSSELRPSSRRVR